MKTKLCFTKFKNHAILYSIFSLIFMLFGILCSDLMLVLYFLCSFVFLGFAAYYTYAYFSYQKHVQNLTPNTGTIFNWKTSGHRSLLGCVILKHEGKEYCSPNYFYIRDAEEMVGKEVSYVIYDDTLLIYEILN